MRVDLDYGRGQLGLELPEAVLGPVHVLEKHSHPALADPARAVADALAAPCESPPLRELARGRRDAVIVVSDKTRPVPHPELLAPLLSEIEAGGIARSAVTILVATGLHARHSDEEIRELLGPEIAGSVRVLQHDARDAESHADLGSTRSGTPILIDRRYVESDLKILTGLIEPHLMAGYSGGRKAVCPGLGSVETIRRLHGPAILESKVGPGILDENPLCNELLEIMERAGADFVANVAIDRSRRTSAVFCGDPVAAHAAGAAWVEAESLVSLDTPADVVVVSAGGHPLDATFYQAIKGIATASMIVRPGGAILLCAALSEGIGSASFEKLLRETRTPEAFEMRLDDPEFFAVDQWMVQHLCQAWRRARVLLYTDGLPLTAAGELLVEAVDSPAAGLERAVEAVGPRPSVAVLPQGPYVLATIAGRKRPLGRGNAWPPETQ